MEVETSIYLAFDFRAAEAGNGFTSGREQRNPMFVFVFVGALFRLRAKRPELEPLFQLPPAIAPRANNATTQFFTELVWIGNPIFLERAYIKLSP